MHRYFDHPDKGIRTWTDVLWGVARYEEKQQRRSNYRKVISKYFKEAGMQKDILDRRVREILTDRVKEWHGDIPAESQEDWDIEMEIVVRHIVAEAEYYAYRCRQHVV